MLGVADVEIGLALFVAMYSFIVLGFLYMFYSYGKRKDKAHSKKRIKSIEDIRDEN